MRFSMHLVPEIEELLDFRTWFRHVMPFMMPHPSKFRILKVVLEGVLTQKWLKAIIIVSVVHKPPFGVKIVEISGLKGFAFS